jgi:formamidopyrimidine-DNA glycosylase
MPEMPEVETIARVLRATILGKRIARVQLSGLALRRPVAPDFAATLQGRTIQEISRRGKYLILELAPTSYWLIHLGMSGRIFFFPQVGEAPPHTHARVLFSDATELQYRDHRRFGLLAAYKVSGLAQIPELQNVGLDPLQTRIAMDHFWPMVKNCRQELKAFLLDQKKIAGVGNIYACEALYAAGLHPARRCHTISREEAAALISAVRKVLRAGVRHGGTTFSDFMAADGEPGTHQNHLHVFQREGEKCRRCRSLIERLRQANRSTYYCPHCQR